ncbi:protein erfK/srfK precursor [Photobacterium aphoticum]|uniref:Protein erfK/srfK n=1 Tax=Photobacterium aphoticum TaxID=754436 RepID=A0A090R6J1_9GAMM|nr:protein erfK/srfK precursor [Photobacterium aphoticum]
MNRGTVVRIINQPLKETMEPDGSVYVEVHEPLSRDEAQLGEFKAVSAPDALLAAVSADSEASQMLNQALSAQQGLPIKLK